MSDTRIVKGLSELQGVLDKLPAKVERNIMRGALRAGAKPIEQEAKRLCPVGPPSATGKARYKLYEGALRDSIRSSVRVKGTKIVASIKVGGKLKNGADVWYAGLIEFTGAMAHFIKARKGGVLAIGGGLYSKAAHPGMQPNPFMRPAMDARATDAVVAAAEYIKKRLVRREGLDAAADIEIEAQP